MELYNMFSLIVKIIKIQFWSYFAIQRAVVAMSPTQIWLDNILPFFIVLFIKPYIIYLIVIFGIKRYYISFKNT